MIALHSNWTKPQTIFGNDFHIDDFNLLTTVLSALKWRETNGEIKMVTDSVGYSFYKERNLLSLWDEVTTELDSIPESINPAIFWAAGKIYAAKTVSAPFAVIDTDFIVWDRLAFENLTELTVIHREELAPSVYPSKEYFDTSDKYSFNPDLDWSLKPANTAFFVMKNDVLRELYIQESTTFMENAKANDPIKYMVFAEQRLLPMCAKLCDIETKEFSTVERLFENGEKYFTHIWGMKQQMCDNTAIREEFCNRCIQRIRTDFPNAYELLKNIPETEKYI